ncbi:MAG: transposase, partial [Acidimicrobiales bacterium]
QWLALLLLRVAETTVGDTWRNIRDELERLHLVTLTTPDGRVAPRSDLTPRHRTILQTLNLADPPRYFDFTPTTH